MNTNTPEDNNNNANVIDVDVVVDESNDNININDTNTNIDINVDKKTISKWDVVFYFICRLSNIFYTTICYVVFPFFRCNFCSVQFSFYWLSPRRSLFSLQFHSILLYCFLILIFILISFLLCFYYYYKWITCGLLADALPGNNSVYMSCSIISHYSV